MRILWAAALVLCIAAVGCHGDDAGTNVDLQGDSATGTAKDLSTGTDGGTFNTDGGSIIGIACGDTPCAANAQYCCTSNQGKTGLCGFGAGAECGSALFYCDGPEDCPPAEPFCCVSNGSATCKTSACPGTAQGGYLMCHTTPDCKGTGPCCASASGTPYRLCIPTGCP